MKAILVTLPLAAILAGCDRAPTAQPVSAAAVRNKVMRERWKGMFGTPRLIVSAANEFGFAAGKYVPGPDGFVTEGKEQVLPRPNAPQRVTTRFSASGTRALKVDVICFSFKVIQSRDPATKKERDVAKVPRRIVQGFLSRFGLGASDVVISALQRGRDATSRQEGGSIIVRSEGKRTGQLNIVVEVTDNVRQNKCIGRAPSDQTH